MFNQPVVGDRLFHRPHWGRSGQPSRMNSVAVLLASLALALPGLPDGAPAEDVARAAPEEAEPPVAPEGAARAPMAAFLNSFVPETANQARVQQRVIIRIAPARRVRQDLIAQLPSGEISNRFQERPMKRCVAVGNIVGVQSGSNNRLILFLRDRRIVSAALEKACSARDFYSGFYVERTADGLLCSGRDTLQSRTGAACNVSRLAQLVAVKD